MGACGVRVLVGVRAVLVVLVRAVSVSCVVGGCAGLRGVLRLVVGRLVGFHVW